MAIVGVVIIRAGMAGGESLRRGLRWTMVGIFLFWEIEWQVWYVATGLWTVQGQLPLHLCSIMIWVATYGLAMQDERVYPLIYFFGIAGSFQAVITPDAVFDFPHVEFLNTMISHSLLVIVGFWIVLVGRYRPTWRDMAMALVTLNVYALVVYPIDVAIDANYLYVVAKPATASLYDLFPDWPWYLLITEVIAAAIFAAMCWPFNRVSVTQAVQRVSSESD